MNTNIWTIHEQLCEPLLTSSILTLTFPFFFYLCFTLVRFRLLCQSIIAHKLFDYVVLVFIFLNCITVALERPKILQGSLVRTMFLLNTSVQHLTPSTTRPHEQTVKALDWFSPHLAIKNLFVIVNEATSQAAEFKHGIPQ